MVVDMGMESIVDLCRCDRSEHNSCSVLVCDNRSKAKKESQTHPTFLGIVRRRLPQFLYIIP